MELSIKDIKCLLKENQVLKESLKQLKTRETLLINNIEQQPQSKRKDNHWNASLKEMKILQDEINGSILEMEKSEKDQLISTLQANLTKSENLRAKFQKEVGVLKTQKDFLETQLTYSEKKMKKKDFLIKKLQLEVKTLKEEMQNLNKSNNLDLSVLSNDIYETGTQLALINKEAAHELNKKSQMSSNNNQEYYSLINELNDRFASTEHDKILAKIDKMIESIHLIPDLQHTILSIMDIAKSNSLITCGKVKFISLTLRN
jgi:chromosome segregation ATPase